jgi:hypothetical protein
VPGVRCRVMSFSPPTLPSIDPTRAADIIEHVGGGKRLDMRGVTISKCPRDIRALIVACWSHVPKERPPFTEIAGQLRAWKPRVTALSHATRRLGGGDALDSLMKK